MTTLRERLRFHGEPKEEILESGRYKLRYQAIDDRRHPDEVKAEGDTIPILVEVFDRDELTHERQYGIHDNWEHRELIEGMRREIAAGIYASKKRTE